MQFQASELHIRAQAKQAGGTFHQRVIGGECHITCLYQFDDFIFFTFIAQFDVLGIEVKGSIGVVIQIHVHLIAHLTRYVQIDFLIEINSLGVSVAFWQRGIVNALEVGTQFQLCRTLCLDTHTTWTEYLLCRS